MRSISHHQFRFPAIGALALAATFSVGSLGCYSEGGLGWSEDQFVYVSRPYQAWTVTLKDVRTGDEIWSVEVPVGKQLVVHFLPGAGTPNSLTPDLMEWAIMDEGVESDRLANSLPVPPANSRRLDPVLRPGPELPSNVRTRGAAGTGGDR